MENSSIKNKIITISGEPVTGKGTNVKALEKKLIEKGYTQDNIHIVTTGHDFRRYFNTILDFIANLDNEEVIKELKEKDEIKSIMDSKKYREKFINAVSKIKASNKDILSSITIEQANNIPELSDIRALVDEIIDEGVHKLGIEINQKERTDEIWIIDSRLAFREIPDSFSVRLTCRPDIAGKRLIEDTTRGKEDNKYKDVQDAIEQREKRRVGEIQRYKERYDIDLTNEDNYNVIIDTSFSSVDDISDTILSCLDRYYDNKFVNVKWTSPKTLLPLQDEMSTLRHSALGNTIDDLIKSIRTNGYNQEEPVEVVEVDGIKYIIEGHHRNFAAGNLQKTLVPYEVLAKDDELIGGMCGKCTARQRTNVDLKRYLLGHEWIFDKKGEQFSYSNIYPDIYEKNKER